MEFKTTLTEKNSKGASTTLKFEPTDHEVCDCDSIIVKVPIDTAGYFIGSQYTVTIAELESSSSAE